MNDEQEILLFTSDACYHAHAVEQFFDRHDIPHRRINISRNALARQQLMALNNGNASVPTLLFPDGTQLTEPSLRVLRARLNIKQPSLLSWVKGLFSRT